MTRLTTRATAPSTPHPAIRLLIAVAARPAEIIRDVAACRRYVDPAIAASALTGDACPLTDRELEVLRAARAGASIAEIAVEVHLAPGTVRNRLSTAMSKLGAPMRHAAAHRAWEQGWI
ncbi:response regulator transcription factor [Streptomyces sp. Tu102]|uniref:response regulator transcription factor n=1 Tax=Streptomyces sp. Tu102 TaxID=2838019 RepID=UPI00254353DC|nr:LuxR C-terminal-related transcriptional regulator [Streptomyces sp. Tu102]